MIDLIKYILWAASATSFVFILILVYRINKEPFSISNDETEELEPKSNENAIQSTSNVEGYIQVNQFELRALRREAALYRKIRDHVLGQNNLDTTSSIADDPIDITNTSKQNN